MKKKLIIGIILALVMALSFAIPTSAVTQVSFWFQVGPNPAAVKINQFWGYDTVYGVTSIDENGYGYWGKTQGYEVDVAINPGQSLKAISFTIEITGVPSKYISQTKAVVIAPTNNSGVWRQAEKMFYFNFPTQSDGVTYSVGVKVYPTNQPDNYSSCTTMLLVFTKTLPAVP